MTDTITIEDLDLHAQWRRDPTTGKRLVRIGANFSGANFSGANFSGASFGGANFNGSCLIGANFGGSCLFGANFSGANLINANFSGANFGGSCISGANFGGANLINANFSGAIGLDIAADAPARLLAVAQAALQPGALNMSTWHTCETTHCMSGWAVHQAGEVGRVLEAAVGNHMAGLYLLGTEAAAHFYDSNEKATKYLHGVINAAGSTTTTETP